MSPYVVGISRPVVPSGPLVTTRRDQRLEWSGSLLTLPDRRAPFPAGETGKPPDSGPSSLEEFPLPGHAARSRAPGGRPKTASSPPLHPDDVGDEDRRGVLVEVRGKDSRLRCARGRCRDVWPGAPGLTRLPGIGGAVHSWIPVGDRDE